MLSEKQHIDDFFRKKEEGFKPDEQQFAAHWEQMQKQLADPGPAAAGNKSGAHIVRHIGKYLGGLLTVAIIIILTITVNRSNKKAVSKTAKQEERVITTPYAVKQDTPSVLPQTAKQSTATIPATSTPIVSTRRRPEPVMTLISPPITKEQPVQNNADEQTNVKLNETKAPKPDAKALLQSFFDQLRQGEQEFNIHTDRDTTLIAEAGTRLVIPANIFATRTGPVKGKVKIIIREFISYEDIIANKLSTTSNWEQLVTGGMLHISAQQDGKPVSIMPQRSIAVSIPTSNYDNNMMLFTGMEQRGTTSNASTINWLPQEPIHNWSDWPIRTTRTLNVNTVEPVSVNYGKKTTAKFYLNKHIPIPKEEISDQLKQRFGTYYDNIKIKRVRPGRVNQRSPNGESIVIDSVDIDPEVAFRKKVKRLQNTLSDTLPRNAFNTEKQVTQQRQYRFTINELGWINCDRFLNDTRAKTNLNVNLGPDITFDDCFQQLVFVRYQSVMLPYSGFRQTVQYQRLPEKEPAILVTVAIKDGKIVSSFMPFVISNKEVGNLVFEPTTPEQFIQKLQSLTITQKQ